MKKILNSTLLFVVASVFATGCINDIVDDIAGSEHNTGKITVTAIAHTPNQNISETRVAFGDLTDNTTDFDGYFPVKWGSRADSNDNSLEQIFYAEVDDSSQFQLPTVSDENKADCQSITNDGKTAAFAIKQTEDATNKSYHAYYPYSAVMRFYHTSDDKVAFINIPDVQKPTELKTVDPAAIVLYANTTVETTGSDLDLDFNHVTAYGRLLLRNLSQKLSGDETISSVRFTAFSANSTDNVALTGVYTHFHDNDSDTTLNSDDLFNTNSYVTVDYSGISNMPTGSALDNFEVWFATAAVENINKISVRLETTKGKTYRREYDLAGGKEITFSAGKVYSIGVNMANAQEVEMISADFKLVTDASELNTGDKIIISNQDCNFAVGQISSTTANAYYNRASITTSNNIITQISDDVTIFILEKTDDGYFGLLDGEKYVYVNGTSDSNNTLRLSNNLNNANAKWDIAINNNIATITNQTTETAKVNKLLQYSSANSRFSNYKSSSGQQNVKIFKQVAGAGSIAVSKASFEVDANPNSSAYSFTFDESLTGQVAIEWDGVVENASISGNSVNFTVYPNFTTRDQTGEIVLTAGDSKVAVVTVAQSASTLSVVPENHELLLPAGQTKGSFTLKSPEFGGEIRFINKDGKFTSTTKSFNAQTDEQTIDFEIENSANDDNTYIGYISVVRKYNDYEVPASARVNILVFQQQSGSITAPENVTASGSTSSFTATWEPVALADHYQVKLVAESNPDATAVYENNSVPENYDDDGNVTFTANATLQADKTYYLYVKSVGGSDVSEWSEPAEFAVAGGPSSIKLTNANINATSSTSTAFGNFTFIDDDSNQWNTNCVTYQKSGTTIARFIQINTPGNSNGNGKGSHIQIPDIGKPIKKIVMTVSSSTGLNSNAGGASARTLSFREKNEGDIIVSGKDDNTVTLNLPNNTLTTGYINSDGSVRIWDVEVFY